jgi:hypothetical protein
MRFGFPGWQVLYRNNPAGFKVANLIDLLTYQRYMNNLTLLPHTQVI